ncbi:MAG: precorrin-3B C(17)-methyltransferase [Pseudomonadota bacterium]
MPSPEPITLFLSPSGENTARQICERLGGALHGYKPTGQVDARIDDVMSHFRALFSAGHPIVAVCAAGIVIRALGPLIADKRGESSVVAVSEDGAFAVPLLGGHRGANAMATSIADGIGAHAAITTAGDLSLGIALDAPSQGWRLENPEAAKATMAALLAEAPAWLSREVDWLAPLAKLNNVHVQPSGDPRDPTVLSVDGAEPLVFREQTLALGVGCSRGCSPDELIALVLKTLADHGRSHFEVAGVYSIDVKTDEAAIHALGSKLNVPVGFFPANTLEAQTPRLANPSSVVFAEVGSHGVAEAAALAAAGPLAVLEIEKHKSKNATCAASEFKDGGEQPQTRGRLSVIGIGPGQSDWRTPEASKLVAEADELVGYGLYIDLLGPIAARKPRHDFPLGGEEDRCRFALERAGEGRNVALICSGDAGIYAMGALVMELLDRDAIDGGVSPAAHRVEVIHAPGVSAFQAASARVGALIGHDFCAISLSDLLTPRETILQRIKGAANGDFVIAFYNPVSKRRRTLLADARDMLLEHRPADTPVILAINLGRPNESLRFRTLSDLHVDEVDMLTVVLVGSSQSRAFRRGDIASGAEGWSAYTPRGYAAKIDKDIQP